MRAPHPPKVSLMFTVTLAANPYVYTIVVEGRRAAEKFAANGKVLSLSDALATPLHPFAIGVLAKCGAFPEIDPDEVPVVPMPT